MSSWIRVFIACAAVRSDNYRGSLLCFASILSRRVLVGSWCSSLKLVWFIYLFTSHYYCVYFNREETGSRHIATTTRLSLRFLDRRYILARPLKTRCECVRRVEQFVQHRPVPVAESCITRTLLVTYPYLVSFVAIFSQELYQLPNV